MNLRRKSDPFSAQRQDQSRRTGDRITSKSTTGDKMSKPEKDTARLGVALQRLVRPHLLL